MSVKEQENEIVRTLLECNNYLYKRKNIIRKVGSNIDLSLYNYNFKSLYCDINNVNLNESLKLSFNKSTHVRTYLDNPYAYIQKVYNFINKHSKDVIVGLNESLIVDKKGTKNDINTYQKDLSNLLKKLRLQNDLIHLDKNVLKIKQQLNKDVLVKGFDINSLLNRKKIEKDTNKQIFSILYDISNDVVIFTELDNENVRIFCLYDINKDDVYFREFEKIYKDNEMNIYISNYKNEYNKTTNYLKYIKRCFNQSIREIYTNVDLIGLKYSDNMYSDQAQKSLALDIQRQKEIFKNT